MAEHDPAVAWSLLSSSFVHSFDYFLRVNPFEIVGAALKKVDDLMNDQLIPLLTRKDFVPDLSVAGYSRIRALMSLPNRKGGINIPVFSNPVTGVILRRASLSMTVRYTDALEWRKPFGLVDPEFRSTEYVDPPEIRSNVRLEKSRLLHDPILRDIYTNPDCHRIQQLRVLENEEAGTNSWMGTGYWQRSVSFPSCPRDFRDMVCGRFLIPLAGVLPTCPKHPNEQWNESHSADCAHLRHGPRNSAHSSLQYLIASSCKTGKDKLLPQIEMVRLENQIDHFVGASANRVPDHEERRLRLDIQISGLYGIGSNVVSDITGVNRVNAASQAKVGRPGNFRSRDEVLQSWLDLVGEKKRLKVAKYKRYWGSTTFQVLVFSTGGMLAPEFKRLLVKIGEIRKSHLKRPGEVKRILQRAHYKICHSIVQAYRGKGNIHPVTDNTDVPPLVDF